ncbi:MULTISPECIES: DUF6637 family protein [Lacrimispora]|jgi:uncharacterized membrane protein|uniref:DUF6637 family protein n=1 Tax=Lacrimispora TaxID=2719231 RepID=UPI000450954B|nr:MULTISPECIES: DUF6637 family protein [Lacrimispora]EXG87350.1 hypothetical protein K413DRAFT_4229 [Clostridium sp. ASBs410]MDR7810938.1 hypothetical protein [Lacrimispora sp.]SEU33578.1 hypothetical protein SAMN05443270_5459 [Lacrimispora sphenoides]
MYIQERGRSLRNASMIVDVLHIVVGILIVTLAVISFLNPEDHMFLFPAIFFLAGMLNLINGIYKIRLSGREKKKKAAGIAVLMFGFLLIALTVISAVSIWWR